MFNTSKYTRWYYSIIQNALSKNRTKSTCYYESHHIIPKSLGGPNTKDNLVLLTVREHMVCHLLLTRMVDGISRIKMIKAANRMFSNHDCNSRLIESIRISHSKSMKGKNNPRFGKPGTMLGKQHSEKTKIQMSISKAGTNNNFYGKNHSNKTKKQISDKNSKSISCSNGTIYKSQVEASKALKLRQGDIANCLAGRQKTVRGYSFAFVSPEKQQAIV